MFQNTTCSQSVSLLQNGEMFQNASFVQSVYLLQNSDMFEYEIKNCQQIDG